MTVTREILMHPDFITEFTYELCEMLENIIDAEFDKGDETDFDFIDECSDAINCIRENGADILPVISSKDFMKRIGIAPKSPAFKIAAIAAALAVVIGIGAVTTQGSPFEIARDVAKCFRELFNVYELEPVTEQIPETTTAKADKSTTQRIKIKWIELRFGDSFRREYYVGESFDKTGLEVVTLTTEGIYTTDDYTVKFDSPFAEKAGEQTVTVTAYGFSESFKVRILNNEKTPILNSIYATFPDETDLMKIQVYAVYSNGDERELSADEYTVTCEQSGSLFRKYVTVTVEYEGCSCSFNVEKEDF